MVDSSFFDTITADVAAEMLAIREEQAGVAPIFWEIVDYQFGWDRPPDGNGERRRLAGKRIRPLLMALVAQAISGGYRHVLPAGAALEFIHNFTLIHDDVMDKSVERRHRPTVWTRWGSTQAINAGDGLFALAFMSGARLLDGGVEPRRVAEACRTLAQASLWTAEGQMLDIDFETRETITTADYIIMITNKTGTLIEAAARIGALLSTHDAGVIDGYAQFARHLGIAFQIRDDYLGVWGDEATTGKSATSDIREKKKAYPVLVGLELAGDDDRAALRRIYAQESISENDVQTVLDILTRLGAAKQTERAAARYYAAALTYLDETGIQNETQDTIRQLAAFLIERVY